MERTIVKVTAKSMTAIRRTCPDSLLELAWSLKRFMSHAPRFILLRLLVFIFCDRHVWQKLHIKGRIKNYKDSRTGIATPCAVVGKTGSSDQITRDFQALCGCFTGVYGLCDK